MASQNRSLLIGIIFVIFASMDVESAGNKANLPDLPLDMDSVEYLVDENTKEHLTKLFHDQIVDLVHFRDEISSYKQKEWLNILVSILGDNAKLFNALVEPICGINERIIQYTKALANEKLVDGFDINVHNDIQKIFEFALEYHIIVDDSFLHANQNVSIILGQYNEIGSLDEDQLFTLEANLETLKNAVDDNVSYAKGAVNKLKHTLKNFVDSTKKLASILHKLQLKIQLKVQNAEQQQKIVMNELKKQLALCLKEIAKQDVQNDIKQNIAGIKEEMQIAENGVYNIFKEIEDVILRREPENLGESSGAEFLPELPVPSTSQNLPPVKLDLPLPNLKPLTINTSKSTVKELIDYFNQYTNIVTPRQLVNSAKKDVVLMDLLKKDRINITLDEKELVKSKITKFETCNAPKPPKGKKIPTGKKLPKK